MKLLIAALIFNLLSITAYGKDKHYHFQCELSGTFKHRSYSKTQDLPNKFHFDYTIRINRFRDIDHTSCNSSDKDLIKLIDLKTKQDFKDYKTTPLTVELEISSFDYQEILSKLGATYAHSLNWGQAGLLRSNITTRTILDYPDLEDSFVKRNLEKDYADTNIDKIFFRSNSPEETVYTVIFKCDLFANKANL